VRIPTPEALLGRLPADLRRVALRFSTQGVGGEGATDEELSELIEFTAHLVCMTLVEVWDEDKSKWDAISLTVDELRGLQLPEEDLTALQAIATRVRAPKQIDAASRAAHGLIELAQAQKVQREEAAGTVDAYVPFRGKPGGAGDGPDGEHLPLQPGTNVLRDKRPNARPAGRRRNVSAETRVGAG
jgi:hypothetical protein